MTFKPLVENDHSSGALKTSTSVSTKISYRDAALSIPSVRGIAKDDFSVVVIPASEDEVQGEQRRRQRVQSSNKPCTSSNNSSCISPKGPLKKRRKRNVKQDLRCLSLPFTDSDEQPQDVVAVVSSDDESDDRPRKSVTFCAPLVTETHTRPYTDPQDLPLLFYSSEDETRFRADYYFWKEFIYPREEEEDAVCKPDEEDSSVPDAATASTSSLSSDDEDSVDNEPILPDVLEEVSFSSFLSDSSKSRFEDPLSFILDDDGVRTFDVVSKAVVVHEGAVHTFTAPARQRDQVYEFDNPTFWNGTVTWY